MQNLEQIKIVELEISSYCNAACPGCARTQKPGMFDLKHITLSDIKRIFPSKKHISEKRFKLCGVLGDPIMNPEALEITEYLVENDAMMVTFSTNGGIQTEDFWAELGSLSKSTGKVWVNFCVDGHKETNHVYRVNTDFNKIMKNMKSYSLGGLGKSLGQWVYIVFDHNEYEIDLARQDAKMLGLTFVIRTGMRNSLDWDWPALREWTSVTKQSGKKKITVSKNIEHSKVDKVKTLRSAVENKKIDENIVKSVVCKHIHEDEIFISSNLKLWPCCFLWDNYFKDKENCREILTFDDPQWNDLSVKSIDEILEHDWYQTALELSWNPNHNRHLNRCIVMCGFNKAYHNEWKRET